MTRRPNDENAADLIPSATRLTTDIDVLRIEAAVREIMSALGEDIAREGVARTPERVAAAYAELLSGTFIDPRHHLETTFDEDHHELVLLRDISFSSLCEHHLLPFTGYVHIGYVPNGRVVGLSKLARMVDGYARRLQTQERLVSQIADALQSGLNPKGCGVVIEASHTCLTIRGINKPGATMVTSAMRGSFQTRAATRTEFLALTKNGRDRS